MPAEESSNVGTEAEAASRPGRLEAESVIESDFVRIVHIRSIAAKRITDERSRIGSQAVDRPPNANAGERPNPARLILPQVIQGIHAVVVDLNIEIERTRRDRPPDEVGGIRFITVKKLLAPAATRV